MVNAAIYGFSMREQAELMMIDRSTDESYEVTLNALLVAIAQATACPESPSVNPDEKDGSAAEPGLASCSSLPQK